MAQLQQPLGPRQADLEGYRSVMRDIQVLTAEYYRETAATSEADALGTRVRACVVFIQIMNERFSKDSQMGARYRALFDAPTEPGADVLRAFKYARHTIQHVLHPVRPDPAALVGGFGPGLRIYANWVEIPDGVHQRLTDATKQLRPYYQQQLEGQEVTQTLLDAAGFLGRVCPDAVHRDHNGEWTGFPLRQQAGMGTRIHPEEPIDHAAAAAWMNGRTPGGDCRVIDGGLLADDGQPILFGLTFANGCSFSPFFETAEQVDVDIALGFPYYCASVSGHVVESSQEFRFLGERRPVFCSTEEIETWAGTPRTSVPSLPEGCSLFTPEQWRQMWSLEAPSFPFSTFLVRRERRMNASPPGG